MIFNTFKYSGVGNSLDGSEDDQLRGYQDIEKGNKIIQTENDYYVTNSDSNE